MVKNLIVLARESPQFFGLDYSIVSTWATLKDPPFKNKQFFVLPSWADRKDARLKKKKKKKRKKKKKEKKKFLHENDLQFNVRRCNVVFVH